MTANPSPVEVGKAEAFEVLKAEVANLNQGGRVPTAAGLKSSLQRKNSSFDERALGYKRFIEFLEDAEAKGYVSVLRDPLNHPRIYPAGEATAKAKAAISESDAVAMGTLRLRSDVWRSVIDWEQNYTRAWDRRISRAFMYPSDDESTPPWEKQPNRFVQMTQISQEQQIGWMKEFAEAQLDNAREELVAALAPGAPRGKFRLTLAKNSLDAAWSRSLQAHAARFVQDWAAANSVSIKHLFDQRSPDPEPAMASASTTETSEPAITGTDAGQTTRLRAELHRVIDRMSLEELASLRIPAGYLIAD
jgi:hypothetical protein